LKYSNHYEESLSREGVRFERIEAMKPELSIGVIALIVGIISLILVIMGKNMYHVIDFKGRVMLVAGILAINTVITKLRIEKDIIGSRFPEYIIITKRNIYIHGKKKQRIMNISNILIEDIKCGEVIYNTFFRFSGMDMIRLVITGDNGYCNIFFKNTSGEKEKIKSLFFDKNKINTVNALEGQF